MILRGRRRGRELETVTSPECFSGVSRETGPWASSSGVLGGDCGKGWEGKGHG